MIVFIGCLSDEYWFCETESLTKFQGERNLGDPWKPRWQCGRASGQIGGKI